MYHTKVKLYTLDSVFITNFACENINIMLICMKRTILLAIILIVSLFTFQMNAAKKSPKTPRMQLIERLAKIQQKGIMYGHQDDPFYGITWDWDDNRSDTYDLVGDFPGVMGFDLGGIEKGDAKNLDSVPFTRIREEIIRQHERGGIVTISWHPRNPVLGTTAWIENDIKGYEEAVKALNAIGETSLAQQVRNPKHTVKNILPGGSQYATFQTWLSRLATFLSSLKDSKGNPIPFIFRPWHENNGNWFWWGQANCSDEEYHKLWNMTQDYVNSRLENNVVWSFSPNLQGNWTEDKWLVRYPGDERVDLIGLDAYQWGSEADFRSGVEADLKLITKIAADHGKLIAMTECGYQNSPDATWWTRVFKSTVENYPICYFLPWRNYKKEHFGASKDASTAADFKQWAKDKRLLFVNDIKKIK